MTDSLVAALDAVAADPERGFVLVDESGAERRLPMPELIAAADGCGDVLRREGLAPGERVAILATDPRDFLLAFFGAVRQGAAAVPLPPPLPGTALADYRALLARLLDAADVRQLVVEPLLAGVVEPLRARLPRLACTLSAPDLARSGLAARGGSAWKAAPDDLALIQFTSGSTGAPRGVRVRHAALLANCRAILFEGLRATRDDVGVSWLPLYHDMGLIGFGIGTALLGARGVLIPPQRFLRRPAVWLDAVTEHRGTISFAPNFALSLIARRAGEAELARWKLGSLRVLGCGAEPIQGAVLRRFEERVGRRCGLPESALLPCYGMAEATLAVAFERLEARWRSRWIDAARLARSGEVRELPADDAAAVEVVCCGHGFRGHTLEVRDERGEPLPPRRQGEIWLRGPSVCDGYWRDPDASASLRRGEWLRTGDLGWLEPDGALYVTGRAKDLIIVHGRNHHPQDLERVAETLDGARPGGVAAFSRPGAAGEEVVVALEVAAPAPERARELRRMLRRRLGLAVAEVVQLPKGSLPKTSSGKIRRREAQRLHAAGAWREPWTGAS